MKLDWHLIFIFIIVRNTKLRALSIHITGVKLSNMLTPEISSARSMQVFENKYRQFFIHCH